MAFLNSHVPTIDWLLFHIPSQREKIIRKHADKVYGRLLVFHDPYAVFKRCILNFEKRGQQSLAHLSAVPYVLNGVRQVELLLAEIIKEIFILNELFVGNSYLKEYREDYQELLRIASKILLELQHYGTEDAVQSLVKLHSPNGQLLLDSLLDLDGLLPDLSKLAGAPVSGTAIARPANA